MISRLWPATDGPANATGDADDYTLGLEFEVVSPAELTAYYGWMAADQEAIDRTFRLYRVVDAVTGAAEAGTDVSAAAGSWAAGQWNRFPLAAPFALTPGQRYRAALLTVGVVQHYVSTGAYWSTGLGAAGITSGPLSAPSNAGAVGNDQGSFNVGAAMAFPASSFNASNYWIDVEVES